MSAVISSSFAGSCDMGNAAYNLIKSATYSEKPVNSQRDIDEIYVSYRNADTLRIWSAIDWADGWRNWWRWQRNIIGALPQETIDIFTSKLENSGLNPNVWGANRFDSDIILSAKMNVIDTASFAKRMNLDYLTTKYTSNVKYVNEEISDQVAYDILSNLYVIEFRKIRQYYYWYSIREKLSKIFFGYNSVTISQIIHSFNEDHPLVEDLADMEAIKKLMKTRFQNEETFFHKAILGKIDKSSIIQLTNRSNLESYFKGVCVDATK
jgi:hypothetical protein